MAASAQDGKGRRRKWRGDLCFVASYPCPGTAGAIRAALERRGLRQTLKRDPHCVIQWTPFSKLDWDSVLSGSRLASSYYVHHGLVRKAELFQRLWHWVETSGTGDRFDNAVALRGALLKSFVHEAGSKESFAAIKKLVDATSDSQQSWVVKQSKVNNALGVRLYDKSKEMLQALEQTKEVDGKLLVQEHVDSPLLLEGKKSHVRVNVLAQGRLRIFMHDCFVVHVASEVYQKGSLCNRYANITNHVLQSKHPKFDASKQSLEWNEFVAEVATNLGEETRSRLALAKQKISKIIEAVFMAFHTSTEGGTASKKFLPMPNAFELFGFDFLLDKEMQPYLLEVNEGPALEGHCKPEVCQKVVEDTLRIVLDPLLLMAGGVDSKDTDGFHAGQGQEEGEAEWGDRAWGSFTLIRDFHKKESREQSAANMYSTELIHRVHALMMTGEGEGEERD